MNASFMRRIIAVAEAANTSIEFVPDFATLKQKFSNATNTTIALCKDHLTDEVETFRNEHNVNLIAWDDNSTQKTDQQYSSKISQCIGDPFSINNYQAAVNLMSYAPSERQWIKQHKWGSLIQTLKLDAKDSNREFKAFTDQLKLTNHPNIIHWRALMSTLIKSAGVHDAPSLHMSCDGNKLKMHITVGAISGQLLWSKLAAAKKLYDSMLRFDLSSKELMICCEVNLGFVGSKIPAVILIVHNQDPQDLTVPSSLEDAG
jgi:hypothetical protein